MSDLALGISRDEAATDVLGIWGVTTFPERIFSPIFHPNFPSGIPWTCSIPFSRTLDPFPNPSEIPGAGTERNSLLKTIWEFHPRVEFQSNSHFQEFSGSFGKQKAS